MLAKNNGSVKRSRKYRNRRRREGKVAIQIEYSVSSEEAPRGILPSPDQVLVYQRALLHY
jgi:hypothetical protein